MTAVQNISRLTRLLRSSDKIIHPVIETVKNERICRSICYTRKDMIQDLEGEIWRDIKGYEGLYQVSNKGRVKSIDRFYKFSENKQIHFQETLLKLYCSNSYVSVVLSKFGKIKTFRVHRLVAIAFIERKTGETDVNHIDENKENNNVENLEWVTHKQNQYHSNIDKNLHSYNEERKRPVVMTDLQGNVICSFDSLHSAFRNEYNIGKSSICKCCYGQKESVKGYKFKFK